jgi:hypothetical protein
VLSERPCRVLVVSEKGARAGAEAAPSLA